ncbi:hypothetical protein [Bacillus benzoevorans]|uniref:Putative membrane protein SirB2 n=1 Tax=Bacillus benzoevorans TaxID=1456 RepID=A0A7X0LV41_9BACI|nr:hypothetical protein [Bacillus benzoevorans]MBB6445120.1 putative membrane protein SirB2 [Bacillus benzoevorans]
MGTTEKRGAVVWERAAFWLVLIFIAAGTGYMFFMDKNTKVFMGFMTLTLMAAISIGQKYMKLPSLFVCILYGFILMAVGFGTFGGMYRIPHFDDALHIFSGIFLGYGSWILLKYLTGKEWSSRLPNSFIVLYIFCFSLAGAGVWELLEFAGDKLFHFTAQGRDPDDTMFDMIDGMIGGAIAAIFISKRKSKQQSSSQ